MNRRSLAKLTWWAEFFTVVITLIYSAIALCDIYTGSPQLSSSPWYRVGFCVWQHNSFNYLDSHTLCFVVDLIVGGALVFCNYRKWAKTPKKSPLQDPLMVATVISFFDVLHGFGHMSMHLYPEVTSHHIPPFSLAFFFKAIVAFNFLFIGPAVGYVFGVPKFFCIFLHVVGCLLFALAPSQFAFGSVQLVINFWFCIPRVLWFGTESEEEIAKRVDFGWACASIGNLFLMPVVFAEMMFCDSWMMQAAGHFQYDFGTLLLTGVYSWVLWGEEARISQIANGEEVRMSQTANGEEASVSQTANSERVTKKQGKKLLKKVE